MPTSPTFWIAAGGGLLAAVILVSLAAAAVRGQYAPGRPCRRCGSTAEPTVVRRTTGLGWAVFAATLLLCFPLAGLGLHFRDDYRECPGCGRRTPIRPPPRP